MEHETVYAPIDISMFEAGDHFTSLRPRNWYEGVSWSEGMDEDYVDGVQYEISSVAADPMHNYIRAHNSIYVFGPEMVRVLYKSDGRVITYHPPYNPEDYADGDPDDEIHLVVEAVREKKGDHFGA